MGCRLHTYRMNTAFPTWRALKGLCLGQEEVCRSGTITTRLRTKCLRQYRELLAYASLQRCNVGKLSIHMQQPCMFPDAMTKAIDRPSACYQFAFNLRISLSFIFQSIEDPLFEHHM